jgi:hypothetical protein
LKRGERVSGMALDTKHFRDYLKLLTGFTEHFETYTTTDLGQLSRQVHECAFWTNILGGAFRDNVRAAGLIPLRLHLEAREVTWAGAILWFHLPGHLGALLSALIGPNRILTRRRNGATKVSAAPLRRCAAA